VPPIQIAIKLAKKLQSTTPRNTDTQTIAISLTEKAPIPRTDMPSAKENSTGSETLKFNSSQSTHKWIGLLNFNDVLV
jgi:hypothetical protein